MLEIITDETHAVLADELASYEAMIEVFDHLVVARALKMTNNNQVHAARLLGINRNTLRRKMAKAGLLIKKEIEYA